VNWKRLQVEDELHSFRCITPKWSKTLPKLLHSVAVISAQNPATTIYSTFAGKITMLENDGMPSGVHTIALIGTARNRAVLSRLQSETGYKQMKM
jgi:hypothetical protein